MKEIVLNVCQGIGDIFWVLQKFYPHIEDKIHINICCLENNNVNDQFRAMKFLKTFPKVGNVKTIQVSADYYNNILAHGYFSMSEIFSNPDKENHFYCCNGPLEKGIRIEDIDKDFTAEETIPLSLCELDLPAEKYFLLYVSGMSLSIMNYRYNRCWLLTEWAKFVELLYKKYDLDLPIFFLGANYDKPAIDWLTENLSGYKTCNFIDCSPEQVNYLLKNSSLFAGYQSGLNVLADQLNAKQIMLYFPHLENMLYTWCKKDNIKTKFHADVFSNSAEKVINNLRLEL